MFSAEVALAPENLSVITIAMTDFHEHGHGFDDSHDKIDAVDDDRLDLVAYLFYKNHCDHCNDNGDNNDSDKNYDNNEENFNGNEENHNGNCQVDLVASPCKKAVENIHGVVAGSLQHKPDGIDCDDEN